MKTVKKPGLDIFISFYFIIIFIFYHGVLYSVLWKSDQNFRPTYLDFHWDDPFLKDFPLTLQSFWFWDEIDYEEMFSASTK